MKTHIVLHHSLTEDSGTVSWPVIRRYHMDARGFSDIGYHLGIEWIKHSMTDGHLEALLGRPFTDRAAAAYQDNMNSLGIHVVFIGNYDLVPPSFEMLKFGAKHVAWICQVFGIELGKIIGHRDVAPYKTCPGTKFSVEAFRARVADFI